MQIFVHPFYLDLFSACAVSLFLIKMAYKKWHFFLFCSLLLGLCYIAKEEFAKSDQTKEKSCPKCPVCPLRLEKASHSSSKQEIYETGNVVDCSGKPLAWNTVGEAGNQFGCHLKELLDWIYSLKTKEKHVFSQHGEDGITEAIFQRIGQGTKYFVEFGVQNAVICNTRFLRETYNWTGLLMDNANVNPTLNLKKESVWIDNIVDLFKKHKVPNKFDYLSVDTDFGDFWLTKPILEAGYKPRVIISEMNRNHAPYTSLTVPSSAAKAHAMFKGSRFYGTSALSLSKLVYQYGYQAVYVEKSSTNIFFIHKSELHNTDLALAHWMKVVSEGSMIGQSDHGIQDPKDAHSHICIEKPCDSSMDW